VPLGRAVATKIITRKRTLKKTTVPSVETIAARTAAMTARVDPDKATLLTAYPVVDEEDGVVIADAMTDAMIEAVDVAAIEDKMTVGMIVEDAITTMTAGTIVEDVITTMTATSDDGMTTETIVNSMPWKVDAVVVEDVDEAAVDEVVMAVANGNATTKDMADMTKDMVVTKMGAMAATTMDMAVVATITTDEVMDVVVVDEAALADVVVAEAAVVEEAQQKEEKVAATMHKPMVVVRILPHSREEVEELLMLLDTHLPWSKQTMVDLAVVVMVDAAFIEEDAVVAAAVAELMWSI